MLCGDMLKQTLRSLGPAMMLAWATLGVADPALQAETSDTAGGTASDLACFAAIGPEGEGHAEAIAAAKRLSQLSSDRLTEVLSAIGKASPLGKNWLRVIAADVADNGPLPSDRLVKFIQDRDQGRDARYAGFLVLRNSDSELAAGQLDTMLDDPSLPLRYLAVGRLLDRAKQASGDESVAMYRQALKTALHPDQLSTIAKALKEAGEEIDLVDHMGFITKWQLVGPFDNTEMKGFDVASDPETEYLESADHTITKTSYPGKSGDVAWASHTSDKAMGMIDLNPIYKNEKSAICYGYVTGEAAKAQDAQIRLGCIVANKVWVNGELVMSNEVYHARTGIDQYIAGFRLRKGRNTILVKICQNDQPQPWAQDWEFQLRVTDPDGYAIKLNQ